ncbi:MAG: 2-oxo acid dehydrogenase subunit E2, partial [Pseudomonadota bacterium]
MPVTITMPALSPTMEEGTLAKWLVKEGDEVRSGDVIAEIETDKAVMEVEAADEGKLGAILVAEGTEGVQVNAPIAVLLEDGESMDDVAAPPPAAAPAEPAVEPEAAAPEPTSARTPAPEASAPALTAPSANGERLFASPLARRIAADKGIDLASIKGSGPRGRIVKADVEAAEAAPAPAPAQAAAPPPAAAAPAAGPDAAQVAKLYQDRAFEEVPLDGMRRTIAARLTEAKQTIPHFYLRRSIELDALLAFRAELNAQLEPKGVKVSVNDFVIKACALALIDEPDCNAAWAGDRMLRFKAADVAVAVAI